MKRVAVTGGGGLLGRAVIKHLARQGYTVRSVDRTHGAEQGEGDNGVETAGTIEFLQADLTDVGAVQNALENCDAVVHLAAIPNPRHDPAPLVYTNNTVSSYNVLHVAATIGIRHICLASSINAIGAAFSRVPRYNYFPLDERHPTYNEDSYSLSKWVLEQQADSFARRWENLTIASLRFHGIVESIADRLDWETSMDPAQLARGLWGFVNISACARACQLSIEAGFQGHEVFYIVAPRTYSQHASLGLAHKHYPSVPVIGDLSGHTGFFNTQKAARILGWIHE